MMPRLTMLAALLAASAAAAAAAAAPRAGVLSASLRADGWVEAVPVAASRPVEFTVAVQLRGMDRLRKVLEEVSDPEHERYGQHLTRDEVNEMTGNPEGTAAVIEWLRAGGVADESVAVSPGGDFVKVRAPASHAASLLGGAAFHVYRHGVTNATEVRAAGAVVPPSLDAHVDYVSAAQPPRLVVHPSMQQQQQPAAPAERKPSAESWIPAGYMTIGRLQEAYGISDQPVKDTRSSLSVYASLGQGVYSSDLGTFCSQMGITTQQIDHFEGGSGSCTSPGGCLEAAMDTQYAFGTASGSETTLWSNNGGSFTDWISNVAAKSSPPLVHSISYSTLEKLDNADEDRRFCDEAAKLGARGVTIVVSSGDDGAYGYKLRSGSHAECDEFAPYFPASCPYVLTVGGTQGPESGQDERACSVSTGCPLTSGGGFSSHFDRPSYQDAVVPQYVAGQTAAKGKFDAGGRGYPDVSLAAMNYYVILGGQQTTGSGTSVSAPVIAGMVALWNGERLAAGRPAVGFVNPALYKLAGTSAYWDMVGGNNECTINSCCSQDHAFYAVAGWDAVTGLGSVNYGAVLKALMR